MILDKIEKFPIVIFSPPRTGSHALAFHLENNNPDIRLFLEPGNISNMKEFWEFSQNNNRYLAKIISFNFVEYPKKVQERLCSIDNFKIKLTRKDIVKQIASLYITDSRDIWLYRDHVSSLRFCEPIIIDHITIDKKIQEILQDNRYMENIPFDVEVFYEDIASFKSKTTSTPKPANYDELLSEISNRLR